MPRVRLADGSGLLLDHHLGLSDPTQHIDRDIGGVALQEDIDFARAHLERANNYAIEKIRQRRPEKTNLPRLEIEVETETGLQQCKRRRACPGLG